VRVGVYVRACKCVCVCVCVCEGGLVFFKNCVLNTFMWSLISCVIIVLKQLAKLTTNKFGRHEHEYGVSSDDTTQCYMQHLFPPARFNFLRLNHLIFHIHKNKSRAYLDSCIMEFTVFTGHTGFCRDC